MGHRMATFSDFRLLLVPPQRVIKGFCFNWLLRLLTAKPALSPFPAAELLQQGLRKLPAQWEHTLQAWPRVCWRLRLLLHVFLVQPHSQSV